MFKIYDGRTSFYQWDRDRKLIVEDTTIDKVYFCNRLDNCSISRVVYEVNGMRLVDVPNLILQKAFDMYVYGYDKNYTKHSTTFDVIACSKPEDYICNEEEVKEWEALEERINQIEENGVSDQTIAAAVDNYLKENPVEAGATEAQAAQIEANASAIAALQNADYATKQYVDEAVAASGGSSSGGSTDLTNYYTKAQTDAAINAAKPDLSGYALKTELPDVSGFQTAEQVNAAIVAYVGVIENGSY